MHSHKATKRREIFYKVATNIFKVADFCCFCVRGECKRPLIKQAPARLGPSSYDLLLCLSSDDTLLRHLLKGVICFHCRENWQFYWTLHDLGWYWNRDRLFAKYFWYSRLCFCYLFFVMYVHLLPPRRHPCIISLPYKPWSIVLSPNNARRGDIRFAWALDAVFRAIRSFSGA
jgi:hypothetical protein